MALFAFLRLARSGNVPDHAGGDPVGRSGHRGLLAAQGFA
jgi:hypothetical protein